MRKNPTKKCPNCGNPAARYTRFKYCRPCNNKFRFWKMVKKTSSCWVWKGRLTPFGYGEFYCPQRLAHRFSYLLHKGFIPKNLFVLHHCDNPPCVNPDHLFVGTPKDNTVDMYSKNRANKKLTPKDVKEIRKLYVFGAKLKLAKKYGVNDGAIRDAALGKTWKHVS